MGRSGGRPKSPPRTWQPKAAASGADDSGLDLGNMRRWVVFRAEFPVRADWARRTDQKKPTKADQKAWCHYRTLCPSNGRVQQEWLLTPFLVPIAEKADVEGPPQEALKQYSDDPASGGTLTQEHYTNIHRVRRLAEKHPLVLDVKPCNLLKGLDEVVTNKFGRATKFHQSPMDLSLTLGHRVEIHVGVTVNKVKCDLLSLWWAPAAKQQLTQEQESLARTVFFDLAEADHAVPSIYAADYNAASGAADSGVFAAACASAPASASGGASAASGTPAAAGSAAASGTDGGRVHEKLTEARVPPHWPAVPPQATAAAAIIPHSPARQRAADTPAPPPAHAPAALPQAAAPPVTPPAPHDAPLGSASAGHANAAAASAMPSYPERQSAADSSATPPARAPAASPQAAAPPVTPAAMAAGIAPHAAPLGSASGGHAIASAALVRPSSLARQSAADGPPPPPAQALARVQPAQAADDPPPPPNEAEPAGMQLPPPPPPKHPPPEDESTAPPAALPTDAPAGQPPRLPPQPADHAAPPAAGTAPWNASEGASAAGGGPPAQTPEEQSDAEESGPDSADDEAASGRGRPAGAPARRNRPRSRSQTRPGDPARGSAASGASDDEGPDADLTRHLSRRKLADLSETDKDRLRQIIRKNAPQVHIGDNKAAWQANLTAAGGEWRQNQRTERLAHFLQPYLDQYCEPIPSAHEFLTGLPHRNDSAVKAGQLWDVVRALASKKMHYLAKLKREVWGDDVGAASGAPFSEAYPDAVLGDGSNALEAWAFEGTKNQMGIRTDDEYVKHILNKHDGEVRHWGSYSWTPVPDGVDIADVRFWHYQFAKTSDVREHLEWYQRNKDQHSGRVTEVDINWILERERGETRLLMREAGEDSASGGTWYIRTGQHVSLAELFDCGCRLCSCHRLYTLYMAQPIFISKRRRSESSAPDAIMRSNAKRLHHQDTGSWGLPRHAR